MSFINGHYFTGEAARARRTQEREEAEEQEGPFTSPVKSPRRCPLHERLGTSGWCSKNYKLSAHSTKSHHGDPKHSRGGVREIE